LGLQSFRVVSKPKRMELRIAIEQHVKMAKSSLGTKKAAIIKRDEDEK
jgi:hypothetical protein